MWLAGTSAVPWFGFGYGCLSAVAAPILSSAAPVLIEEWLIVILTVHFFVFGVTVHGGSWKPLVSVSVPIIRSVQAVLVLLTAITVWITWGPGSVGGAPVAFYSLSGAYIAAHWALRPENFLPPLIRWIANPFLSAFDVAWRWRRRLRRERRRRMRRVSGTAGSRK